MVITKKTADFHINIDTPTIANALEIYIEDRPIDGFTKVLFVYFNSKLKPIIGVPKTAKISASSNLSFRKTYELRIKFYEYMSDISPYQEIKNFCVIEDLDWPKTIEPFWGEFNVSINKGLILILKNLKSLGQKLIQKSLYKLLGK